ncbi:hypothetical protein VY88_19650 [Azospirillum thiophilum]|uniref:Uncharacterized protein n=1 Tax=Azospirillum thiophilum TaxID=528244 RepID=A0AAC8ZVT6_9PROT|nr:hypothetical protein [Azospirillum thiophilum]ALG73957.1 hypothetical protein AL072_23265 [Azospirillum thiophilum]KJR63698.1 hypothetical protein VY88_19650 [Azospirillum thiophilum]
MPIDASTLKDDRLPSWAEEPPVPAAGSLVPGSQFHEEQWIMAAGMLARGNSFLQVARAMGCSRTTLWRAYYGSKDFRVRVWWEREALNREAELRLSSLRALVAEQIERLVAAGDPATVRWLAERLGLFAGLDAVAGPGLRPSRQPEPAPAAGAARAAVPELDDDGPGLLRERTPPHPAIVAAILARPEADGPKGVYPWTLTPEDAFPNLAPGPVSRRGSGAFSRRL